MKTFSAIQKNEVCIVIELKTRMKKSIQKESKLFIVPIKMTSYNTNDQWEAKTQTKLPMAGQYTL